MKLHFIVYYSHTDLLWFKSQKQLDFKFVSERTERILKKKNRWAVWRERSLVINKVTYITQNNTQTGKYF